MDSEEYRGLREFARIDAHIPMEARVVSPHMLDTVSARVLMRIEFAQSLAPPAVDDKALHEWLVMINSKLDALINMLNYQREGFLSLPFVNVNLSGGGMQFLLETACAPGDVLEIKMLLPESPPVPLYLYGEVLTADPDPAGCRVALRFVAMDEEIRDIITRYVFNRQREMLREMKNKEE